MFRHCVFPIAFRGNPKTFAREKFIHLEPVNGILMTSVAWEKCVPTKQLVHQYGCRLARGMNEKKLLQGKYKEKDRHVYCGAYQLLARDIRALPRSDGLEEIASADVIHAIENGEIAHANVAIILKDQNHPGVEGTKTAIVDRLWRACTGPMQHVCEDDEDIPHHPTSELIDGPSGKYKDGRSSLVRFCCNVRFRVLDWVWQTWFKSE